MSEEDVPLDALLARGSLGGPQYDEILERVLDRTATEPARWRRLFKWTLVPGGVLAAACAAWLLFFAPPKSGFGTKGTGGKATDALRVGCAPVGGLECRLGSTLMISVNAALSSGYVGAYAERADDPSHARIWYFPTAAGSTPVVAQADRTVVVPEGVRIGSEHRPGTYRVTVWLSNRPLSRAEVDHTDPDAIRSRATFEVHVSP